MVRYFTVYIHVAIILVSSFCWPFSKSFAACDSASAGSATLIFYSLMCYQPLQFLCNAVDVLRSLPCI